MNDTTQNPWQTLSSEVRYDNKWLTIRHEEVLTPAQTPGIYGVVNFKNKAIGVVPIDDQGNIYLVGQYRYTLQEYSWEIPEGGCPIGDDPLEAAQRELKEETGLIAATWTRIGRIHTSNSATDEEGFVFLAENLTQSHQELEETEQIVVKKIPLTQAVEMVMNAQITDAISQSAILMVARLKNV